MPTPAADLRTATKGAAKAPISTHPLFPAIVALWFAALLGLGSLVLPTLLLERLVTVTGLSSIVPMAAPPLGFTARATVALVAATLGAVLGLLLARQVADSHAPKPKPRFSRGEERACRPISAHDELGEEGLGNSDAAPVAQKRRSLAIAEDNRRSEYLEHVPLPGQVEAAPLPEEPDEALELGEFAAADDVQTDNSGQDEIMNEGSEPISANEQAGRKPAEAPADHPKPRATFASPLEFAPPSLRRAQGKPSEMPSFLSLQYHFDDEEPVEPYIAPGTFGTPADPDSRPFAAPAPAQPHLSVVETEAEQADEDDSLPDERPLDDLGLVQLAARLGASIERRRAMRASEARSRPEPASTPPVFTASPDDFDVAAAEDAALARASFFTPQAEARAPAEEPAPDALPEAASETDPGDFAAGPLLASKPTPLRNWSFDEDDEAEEADLEASLSLPRASLQPFDDEFDAEEDEVDDETEYSSLLAMKNPFQKKAEFVRIDEPEPDEDEEPEAAVTFPAARSFSDASAGTARRFDAPELTPGAGATPADPADAERELRAALATLQRMSGAA